MNMDKQSVVNFLTPTKLVHSTLKSRPRVNLNSSQQSHSSNRNQYQTTGQIPAYSFTAQFDKLNGDIDRSRQRKEENILVESRRKEVGYGDRNNILNNTSKTVIKSQDQNQSFQSNRFEEKSLPESAFNLQPVEYSLPQPPVQEVLANVKRSGYNSRVDELSRVQKERSRQESREEYSYNDNNKSILKVEGSIEQLTNLMDSLRGVKDTIDLQLSELQNILDNTSRYLNDINEEYLRIKQRIIDYTSQVLDASFTKYKENMVNWARYQDAEKKTIAMLAQIQKTVREDQIVVRQMARTPKGPRVALGKQQQLIEKIDFYGNYANELKTTKLQCVSMRPQIKRDRILDFQKALTQLAQF